MVPGLSNVGGVKCQPFLKHSNHWKRALKMIFKGSGYSSFLKLSLLLQRKKTYALPNVVGVDNACTTVTNFCSEGKVMLLLSVVRYQVSLCFRLVR